MTRRVRVLACGSFHGGDDAAALEALKRLPPEVADRASLEEVLLISAEHLLGDEPDTVRLVIDCVHGLEPGSVVELPLAQVPALEARLGAASSHAIGLGQAVALAARLGGLHPDDRFLGIGGARYEMGPTLSPAVEAGLAELVARVADRVG
jgi:hydrogenase maturation protease